MLHCDECGAIQFTLTTDDDWFYVPVCRYCGHPSDSLTATQTKHVEARNLLEAALHTICYAANGAFDNGVEAFGLDEGAVRAAELVDAISDFLKKN